MARYGTQRRGFVFYPDSLLGRMVQSFAPPKLESSTERLLRKETMLPAQKLFRRRLLGCSGAGLLFAALGASAWQAGTMVALCEQEVGRYEEHIALSIQRQKEEAAEAVRQAAAEIDAKWRPTTADVARLQHTVDHALGHRRFFLA
jgi:hypothetical protein